MAFVDNTKVAVNNAATVIALAKTSRNDILIQNNSNGVTLFLGTGNDVTVNNGFPIAYQQSFSGFSYWKGDWYGIVSSGSCDVRVLEAYETRINGVGT